MGVCKCCGREMLTAKGCRSLPLRVIGKSRIRSIQRVKVGAPGSIEIRLSGELPKDFRCGDCGAKVGGYHHPGCDLEPCPICGNQLISCDCQFLD